MAGETWPIKKDEENKQIADMRGMLDTASDILRKIGRADVANNVVMATGYLLYIIKERDAEIEKSIIACNNCHDAGSPIC